MVSSSAQSDVQLVLEQVKIIWWCKFKTKLVWLLPNSSSMSLRLRRNLIFIVTWIKLIQLNFKNTIYISPLLLPQIKYLSSKLTGRIFLFSPTSQHQTKYKKFPTWLKFIKVEFMFCKIILFLSQHGTSPELDSYIFGFIYFIYLNIVAVALSFIKLMLGLVYSAFANK